MNESIIEANEQIDEYFYRWWSDMLSSLSNREDYEMWISVNEQLRFEELCRVAFKAGAKAERLRAYKNTKK